MLDVKTMEIQRTQVFRQQEFPHSLSSRDLSSDTNADMFVYRTNLCLFQYICPNLQQGSLFRVTLDTVISQSPKRKLSLWFL